MPPSLPSDHSRSYSNPYEESFAETMGLGEIGRQEQGTPETSIDRDNKLLSFNMPTYNFELLNWSLQRTSLSLTAQLHGMFFVAETSPEDRMDMNAPSSELTCYRRNLFQVTGSITLPRTLRYIITDQGHRIPILAQELSISATESGEGHSVKLISVPWKTPASGASSTPEDKSEREPTSIPLDIMSNQDMDADYATFPIAWKRLQFRIATANNGRRKELQQHFVVRLKVVATLSTGTKIPICGAKSGVIIVRGRSPRNFQQRKELPVGSLGNTARKTTNSPRGVHHEGTNLQPSPMKAEKSPDLNLNTYSLDKHDIQTPNTFNTKQAAASARPSIQARSSGDKGTVTTQASPSPATSGSTPTAPMKLSFSDDNEASSALQRLHKAARTNDSSTIAKPPMFKMPSFPSSTSLVSPRSQNPSNGLDSADLLYEYFPLGLDDWMPPVDAVYRPHVVHHVTAGGSVSAKPGLSGRSKRYFSEDQA